MELMLFKDSVLRKEKEDIFRDSYRTEIFVNLYEILLVHTENLQSGVIRELLQFHEGILESLYLRWQYMEDNFYEELRDYACSELEAILENNDADGRKEDGDGEEPDQAAQSRRDRMQDVRYQGKRTEPAAL